MGAGFISAQIYWFICNRTYFPRVEQFEKGPESSEDSALEKLDDAAQKARKLKKGEENDENGKE